jgi:hypothetical protein
MSFEFLVPSKKWSLYEYGWFKKLSGFGGLAEIHGLG